MRVFADHASTFWRSRGSGTRTDGPVLTADFLLQFISVFAAYFVAGKLGQATSNIRSSNLGPVWPAYGVALASTLACGYRVWPAIAASAFVIAVQGSVSAVAAVGQAAGATLAATTGTFLLRRIPQFDPTLSRLRDALALIVLGAFASALVSSAIGVFSLYATGVQAYSGLRSAWLIYWLGDATGVLLVTPIVFALPRLARTVTGARTVELVALFALLTVACGVVFGDWPARSVHLHVLAFAVLPFVMWGAIDFGIAGAAVSVFWIAALATVLTALGHGPFSGDTSFINAVMLDVFFTALSLSGLCLAAVIAEREREQERHRAKQARSDVNRRLIAAQDEERARIARELHDDIGQRLSLLVCELAGNAPLPESKIARARAAATQIAEDLQALSHRLHSWKVEILGLAKSSRALCADFATQQKISVTFDEADVMSAPPAAVSLCLYRILQEALHNVAKHSGARAVAVELRGTAADIRLVVQDDGRGFDAAAAASHGIGLASMHERIELVGGGLTVESAPERGTRIEARVPIPWPRPA